MVALVGGIATFSADGKLYNVRGDFNIQGAPFQNEPVVGQDTVHGYIQKPLAQYIEATISDQSDIDITQFTQATGPVTVTVRTKGAGGKKYILSDAVYVADGTVLNTGEGSIKIKFFGKLNTN